MRKLKMLGCLASVFLIGLLLVNYLLVPYLLMLLLGSFGLSIAYWQALIVWFLVSLLFGQIKGSVTIK